MGTNTHLQATLDEIQAIANDVEMQPPPSELGVYMVVDTNILLHQYEVLRTFVEDVEKTSVPVVVVVPGIVVQELDRQKKREDVAWPARRASGWLLEKVRLHRGVKVQATDETCKPSKNWRSRVGGELAIPDDMMNDHLIIDCAQHFQERLGNTVLWSADHNLCIIAQSQGVPIMTPAGWTSREIVQQLYGTDFPLTSEFSSSSAASRSQQRRAKGGQDAAGDSRGGPGSDMMMIDDDTVEAPLNVLHDDVREHFTRLLLRLVESVGGADVRGWGDASLAGSRYAPDYMRKRFAEWGASESLEYLYDKSKGLRAQMLPPAPEVFLGKRYTARGARNGWEWSRADWCVGLDNLARVGAAFGAGAVGEAAEDVRAAVA